MAQRSLDLIEAMRKLAEPAQPITGRGVGYKLFTSGLITSMARQEMQRVYRLLKQARETGVIPWSWIVDETRSVERVGVWSNPQDYARLVAQSYRRDFWDQQPVRVELASEKGTVRGVLQPVLAEFGVGFRVMHGFTSATSVHDIAADNDGRRLVVLYVGDYDPSGLFMSEVDLPTRLREYGGSHVSLQRVALTRAQVAGLSSFAAADKRKDPRFRWFQSRYGDRCWEIDAMDPNDLRQLVEGEIRAHIELSAWERCERVNKVEQQSLAEVMSSWGRSAA